MALAAVHHRQPDPQLVRAQDLRPQDEEDQACAPVVHDDLGIIDRRVHHLLRSHVILEDPKLCFYTELGFCPARRPLERP